MSDTPEKNFKLEVPEELPDDEDALQPTKELPRIIPEEMMVLYGPMPFNDDEDDVSGAFPMFDNGDDAADSNAESHAAARPTRPMACLYGPAPWRRKG